MIHVSLHKKDTSIIQFLLMIYNKNATGKTFALLLLVVVIVAGCRKDFDFSRTKDLSWTPDLALPLVSDSLTLKDALEQTGTEDHFVIDESGDISILYYYNNNAFTTRPADLIHFPPANFLYTHSVTQQEAEVVAYSDLIIPSTPYSLTLFDPDSGIRVDRMVIKGGRIIITGNHTFSNDGNLTLALTDATLGGKPFVAESGPFTEGYSQTITDLAGVTFNLSKNPNTLAVQVEGLLKQSTSITAGDRIDASVSIIIDSLLVFEGFLGTRTIYPAEDTVSVDVFNNAFAQGNIFFVDPQASVTIVNSIGLPALVTVEKLLARNDASGMTLDIASRLGSNAEFMVPSPTPGNVALKTMTYTNLNTGNSMNDLFDLKPDMVAFRIRAKLNPVGSPVNFFTDTSTFKADIRVKLPLYGHFDHLTFQDTFDLAIEKPEEIEKLAFRSYIVNGLPLTARVQLYFTDGNYQKLDSLTGDDRILIREAPVDPATHLPYPGMYGEKDTTFYLEQDRMAKLEGVKYVLLNAVLNSTNEGSQLVKMRADQLLRVTFTARAKLRTTIDP